MKIHWKAYLLVFDYWFCCCCCCHIWNHRLTVLKSTGFLPLIWPNVWFSPTETMQQSEWLQHYLFQSWAQIKKKRWLWGKFWDKGPILSSPMAGRSQPNLSCFVGGRVFEVALLIRDLAWSYKTILLAGKISLVYWCHCGNIQRTKSWRFYSGLRRLKNPWSLWQE